MSERNIVRVINRYGSDGSIALAARISYGAKHVESERVKPIITGLIANKEGTPFEFASMWFYIRCSRLCHSQFLQYRHASRITRSTRRVDPIESENADLDKLSAGYEQTHIDYALRDYAFQTDELKIPREIARRILRFHSFKVGFVPVNTASILSLIFRVVKGFFRAFLTKFR